MRHTLVIAVVIVLALGARAASGADGGAASTHVRCLGASASELLDMALKRSAVIRELVERLEGSDVTVYLQLTAASDRRMPAAHLTFVAYAAGTRYLLVQVDPWRTIPVERVALLAHELCHALEVAGEPGVRDLQTLRALYLRIGHEYADGRFETASAQSVGRRVQAEIGGPG